MASQEASSHARTCWHTWGPGAGLPDRSESLVKVGDQVVHRLDPYREAHEVAGHFQRRSHRGGVRHPAGVLDERLHPTKGLPEQEKPGPVADLYRGGLARPDAEADHSPEAAHLPGGDGMPGMIGQARVEDL